MTVGEHLAASKASHYRAHSFRRSHATEQALEALRDAREHRAAASLADPRQEDIAWLQPMAGARTHRDMHGDLVEFYRTQGAE